VRIFPFIVGLLHHDGEPYLRYVKSHIGSTSPTAVESGDCR
jgi:hypothetical protein